MQKRDLKLQVAYCFAEGGYWLVAVVLGAFITPLLISKGFSEYEIGVITAVKCVATCVFQILIANFADKYAKKIQLKYIIAVLLGIGFLTSIIFYFVTPGLYVTLIIFVLFGIGITCTSPLIDSLSALFMNHGRKISFTVARACGSVTWAIASLALGTFCTIYGENNLLLVQAFFILFLIAVILLMEKVPTESIMTQEDKEVQEVSKEEEVHSVFWILKTYPNYTIYVVGVFLATVCFNLSGCFMINAIEMSGGTQTHYGIAEFVLAISELPTAILFSKLRKMWKLDTMFIIFAVSNTLKAFGILLWGSVWLVVGFQTFEMFGFGLFYAANLYFVMEILPQADVVKGVSFVAMINSGIGAGVGYYLAGVFMEAYGLRNLLIISVVFGIFSIIVMVYNSKKIREKEERFDGNGKISCWRQNEGKDISGCS